MKKSSLFTPLLLLAFPLINAFASTGQQSQYSCRIQPWRLLIPINSMMPAIMMVLPSVRGISYISGLPSHLSVDISEGQKVDNKILRTEKVNLYGVDFSEMLGLKLKLTCEEGDCYAQGAFWRTTNSIDLRYPGINYEPKKVDVSIEGEGDFTLLISESEYYKISCYEVKPLNRPRIR